MILPSQIIPLLLLAGHARAVQFVCHDGSVATCGDGTAPLLHEGLFARGDLGSRSMCPESCNVFKNKCTATAPTCIYPNPQVPNPRAACACRPGFKADGVADGDTTKHWRVPVEGQEHRVWVAEGVSCNTLCGGYGAQSCSEVTMLGPDCVGDVVPGQRYPGMVYPGGGPDEYNAPPFGKNTSTAHFAGGIPEQETGGRKGIPTDVPLTEGNDTGEAVVDSSTGTEPTGPLDSGSSDPIFSDTTYRSEAEDTDLSSGHPKPTKDISVDASLFSNMPLQTGEASKDQVIPDYLSQGGDMPTPDTEKEDITAPFKVPTKRSEPQRRDFLTDIRNGGQQRAWNILVEQWNWYMDKMSTPHSEFKMDERPALCNIIKTAVSEACNNAIDTENTNCSLEPSGKDPKCQQTLTKDCCDKQRNEAFWCRGRWSNENFALAIRDLTSTCGISTAGGRDALKLGVYRRLLDPLQSIIKEASPAPPFLQKAAETQQKWLLWERELRYLVGGDAYRGINGLIEITGKISTAGMGYNGVKWSEAIEEPLSQTLNAFMLETIGKAFDVFAIANEREFLVSLNEGAVPPRDDVVGIRAWADEFADKKIGVFLPSYPGRFSWQTTQAEVDETVEHYKRFLEVSSFPDVARAWAVVPRADRVMK